MNTPVFANSEQMRILLYDLTYSPGGGWRTDPRATDLMRFAMDKYAGLARKHGLEPGEAAVAAFEVMRMRSTRLADDPWAVITRAVELTLIYESRAAGLLCSTSQARKSAGSDFHDPQRFSDREAEITDYHPAFHCWDDLDAVEEPPRDNLDGEPTSALVALDVAVEFFMELGWQEAAARLAVEYIAARLMRCRDRARAYVSLRRDGTGPALLDIGHDAWLVVLRAVLGNQRRDREDTGAGLGILGRLVTGECLDDLFADHALADAVRDAAPAMTVSG
ncbi:MAG: hypothetical protein GX643_00350 [Acidimicrobiales bacterium]|nr:hypothetical protein [Acidimicrobiales bacterium]